jgi:hypothetical protein
MSEQVGTVEILVTRVYVLDAETAEHPLATSVVVGPGTYPLYRDFDAYYWVMTGRINARGSTKIGDGLFMLGQGDAATGPEVMFPSTRFGLEQWTSFTAEPVCTEGAPAQRLRIRVTAEVDS